MRWLSYSAHKWTSPYGPQQAAFKSASADLSLTPVTYLCKLLGIRCVAAFLQLELFGYTFLFMSFRPDRNPDTSLRRRAPLRSPQLAADSLSLRTDRWCRHRSDKHRQPASA
ncbi:hypothetical protein W909_06365 [Dickeya zeae EC1]|nr:hypothetical protein W909_06365 [Dickeya zeae EC1]